MHKSAVLAASAALGLAFTYAGSVYSAPSIYPVDTARFLAGSRFDFKVEFDGKVNEKDVRVLINGKPAESRGLCPKNPESGPPPSCCAARILPPESIP